MVGCVLKHRARLAQMSGADLTGADLRNIVGMTPDQIRALAVTDKNTEFGDVERRGQR
ncbi:hypothetical protein [Amycolatopsis sp. H20-H5]|uniref:hypothetical protein n=1 Tax=Amycolatopsis sp. H20-H5 TaxID=3046309 RepID=UPI003FA3989A